MNGQLTGWYGVGGMCAAQQKSKGSLARPSRTGAVCWVQLESTPSTSSCDAGHHNAVLVSPTPPARNTHQTAPHSRCSAAGTAARPSAQRSGCCPGPPPPSCAPPAGLAAWSCRCRWGPSIRQAQGLGWWGRREGIGVGKQGLKGGERGLEGGCMEKRAGGGMQGREGA